MKKILLIICLSWCLPAYAGGMSNGSGLTMNNVTCTTVVTGPGSSPQTATCAAGFFLTGLGCGNSVNTDISAPTSITGGSGGSVTCSSNAGNVTTTAICCH